MIKRLIQLVLDAQAAAKLEREIDAALDKSTKSGADKARQNLSVAERALNGLKDLATRLGAALAAAFGVRAIINFGKESIRAASEAGAVWNRLAGQLEATGTAFSDVEADIRSAAEAMQESTTVGDEEFAAVLTELVGVTGDYRASLAEVQTVADLAAAKQMDLQSAAKLVGKAMVGQTGELSRYGIIVEDGADAMQLLRERFRGMAENEGATLHGRLEMLSNAWGDFKEAVGDAMIEAGGGTSVLDTLIGTVRGLTAWVNENRNGIANWGRLIVRTFQAVYESVRFVVRQVVNTFDIIGSAIAIAMLHIRERVAMAVNGIIEGLNWIPGVNIEFRMNEMTPEEFAVAQQGLFNDIKGDVEDLADAVWDLGDAYLNVGVAARDAVTGQAAAANVPPPRPRSVFTPSGPTGLTDEEKAANARFLRQLEATAAANEAARKFREEELEKLRDTATPVAEEMTQAFETFFTSTAEGFEAQGGIFASAAEAARGAGAAIVSGLIQGRAEEQMAAGTAALASGTWPPNPAAIAAAFKHFAAAALYRAIPAVIRGGGGGRSGGGFGGSASIPRGAIGTSVPGTREVMGAEVHIYIDPLSPTSARVQALVAGAMQNATERWGPNARVQIHPASG